MEVLLSSLILAIGTVVICGLCHRCVINNARGWEYEQAYRLLDETLDMATAQSISELARQKQINGDFGDRYPQYRYKLEVTFTQDSNNLYRVTATVLWNVMNREYQVQTTTLLFDG